MVLYQYSLLYKISGTPFQQQGVIYNDNFEPIYDYGFDRFYYSTCSIGD